MTCTNRLEFVTIYTKFWEICLYVCPDQGQAKVISCDFVMTCTNHLYFVIVHVTRQKFESEIFKVINNCSMSATPGHHKWPSIIDEFDRICDYLPTDFQGPY